MEEDFPHKELTEKIIGAGIEVHRVLGPGYLEAVYEEALGVEFELRGIEYERQKEIVIDYKGSPVGKHRLDFVVEDTAVVEIKSVERFDEIHRAQVISYCKATGKKVGLLINFNVPVLKDGIKRIEF
jgi:GxxExxY protein